MDRLALVSLVTAVLGAIESVDDLARQQRGDDFEPAPTSALVERAILLVDEVEQKLAGRTSQGMERAGTGVEVPSILAHVWAPRPGAQDPDRLSTLVEIPFGRLYGVSAAEQQRVVAQAFEIGRQHALAWIATHGVGSALEVTRG